MTDHFSDAATVDLFCSMCKEPLEVGLGGSTSKKRYMCLEQRTEQQSNFS